MRRVFTEHLVGLFLHLGILPKLKSINGRYQPILGVWNVAERYDRRSLLACLLKVDG